MSIGTQKFRPYFSSEELLEIITALQERPTPQRVALCKYLDGFAMKIHRGTLLPQHVLKGTISQQMVVAMGLVDPPAVGNQSDGDIYAKWKASPTSCSPLELQRVMLFRFQNNLMTEEEESIYLSTSGVNY